MKPQEEKFELENKWTIEKNEDRKKKSPRFRIGSIRYLWKLR